MEKMNKKGVVLRDVLLMSAFFSFVLILFFLNAGELANEWGNETHLEEIEDLSGLEANNLLYDIQENTEENKNALSQNTGKLTFILDVIGGTFNIFISVVTLPVSIGNAISGLLVEFGISSSDGAGSVIGTLISIVLYIIIIFTIISALLKGGKV